MHSPVIDTNEIIIETEDLPPFDSRLKIVLPAACVQKITSRLVEGGMQQTNEQLVQILLRVCVDEVLARQERPSLWGPAFVGRKPSFPQEGEDFSFEIMMDRLPDFDLPAFEDLTIHRPTLQITEELVQREIHFQCLEAGDHRSTDAQISVDHRVTLDVQVFSDDSERDPISLNALVGRVTDESQPIVLNGLKFKDLNHALLGRVVGDVVESSISLPKVLQASGFSQETHRAIITIQKVEISNPLSVDEVIKMYGSPNILVLKNQIKASLERRFELDKMAFMTDDLFRQLLERIDYSPPERIVKSREFEIGQNAFKTCQANGGSEEEARSAAEKAISSAKKSVLRSVKRQAISGVLASKLELQLGEEDVQEQIRNLAALQGKRPEDYRQELIDSGKIHAISAQVLEQQITRLALGQAGIVDIDPE